MRPQARIFGGTQPMLHPDESPFTTSLPRREWFQTRIGWASRERQKDKLTNTNKSIMKLVSGMSTEELKQLTEALTADFITSLEKPSCL